MTTTPGHGRVRRVVGGGGGWVGYMQTLRTCRATCSFFSPSSLRGCSAYLTPHRRRKQESKQEMGGDQTSVRTGPPAFTARCRWKGMYRRRGRTVHRVAEPACRYSGMGWKTAARDRCRFGGVRIEAQSSLVDWCQKARGPCRRGGARHGRDEIAGRLSPSLCLCLLFPSGAAGARHRRMHGSAQPAARRIQDRGSRARLSPYANGMMMMGRLSVFLPMVPALLQSVKGARACIWHAQKTGNTRGPAYLDREKGWE